MKNLEQLIYEMIQKSLPTEPLQWEQLGLGDLDIAKIRKSYVYRSRTDEGVYTVEFNYTFDGWHWSFTSNDSTHDDINGPCDDLDDGIQKCEDHRKKFLPYNFRNDFRSDESVIREEIHSKLNWKFVDRTDVTTGLIAKASTEESVYSIIHRESWDGSYIFYWSCRDRLGSTGWKMCPDLQTCQQEAQAHENSHFGPDFANEFRADESIRGISTYGKVQMVGHGGGGQMPQGNIGGPRNQNAPGYPLPAAQRSQTTSEPSLEEVVDDRKTPDHLEWERHDIGPSNDTGEERVYLYAKADLLGTYSVELNYKSSGWTWNFYSVNDEREDVTEPCEDLDDGIEKCEEHFRMFVPRKQFKTSDFREGKLYEWRRAPPEKLRFTIKFPPDMLWIFAYQKAIDYDITVIEKSADNTTWKVEAPDMDCALWFIGSMDAFSDTTHTKEPALIAPIVRSGYVDVEALPTNESISRMTRATDLSGKQEKDGFCDEPDIAEMIHRIVSEAMQPAKPTEVIETQEYKTWYATLTPEEKKVADKLVNLLKMFGHTLGYPHSEILGTVNKNHSGMRVLRQATGKTPIRIAYMFTPDGKGVVLTGYNKKGKGDSKTADNALYNAGWTIWDAFLKQQNPRKKNESKITEGATASNIVVTMGEYQPFHKGHSEQIRALTQRFSKVVIIIASPQGGPFTYKTRLKMMKASLPDVWGKIEVYPAQYGNKYSDFIPGIIQQIVAKYGSSIKEDSAVNILVPEDKVQQVQQQIDDNSQHSQTPGYFKGILSVGPLEGNEINDETVVQIVTQGDEEKVKEYFDPHLVSNESDFGIVYTLMRRELRVQENKINEGMVGQDENGVYVSGYLLPTYVRTDMSKIWQMAKLNDVELSRLTDGESLYAWGIDIRGKTLEQVAQFIVDIENDPASKEAPVTFDQTLQDLKVMIFRDDQDFGREDEMVRKIVSSVINEIKLKKDNHIACLDQNFPLLKKAFLKHELDFEELSRPKNDQKDMGYYRITFAPDIEAVVDAMAEFYMAIGVLPPEELQDWRDRFRENISDSQLAYDFGREYKDDLTEAIVNAVINEIGDGAMGGTPGTMRGGRHGGGSWSMWNPRALFQNKMSEEDEDPEMKDLNPPVNAAPGAEATYMQMTKSPETRMAPVTKQGDPDHPMPGINSAEEDREDEISAEKPTDLSRNVTEVILKLMGR